MRMYITRDPNGDLKLFKEVPFYSEDLQTWCEMVDGILQPSFTHLLIDDLFPEVTFENSPQEVVLELSGEKKFTDEELSNPILRNMTWRVDTPSLLNEVANCSNQGIYSPVMAIFGRVLACVADRATQLNDPILNICMLKLKMYEVPHEEIQTRINEQLKRIEDGN